MSVDLFELLPAVYRVRDAQIAASQSLEQGPLQSLLALIGEQIAAVTYDVDQLYDDQFIETCAAWVIPYIGDLIGYQSIRGIAPTVDNPRAEVAETIALRRRKGTVLVMEQLARDVTAWGAHAVEMFRLLGDTQYLKHPRLQNFYAPDLRCWRNGLYADRAFDRMAHRVDVRSISARRGRYNVPNVGIYLWSLGAYRVTNGTPAPSAANAPGKAACYRFNPLGMDAPLFHRATPQGERIEATARPNNVPDRLHRRVLCEDLAKGVGATYYGPSESLALVLDGNLVNPYQLEVADLSGPEGSWSNLPAANGPYLAAVDPELGRIALPPAAAGSAAPQLTVTYYYGFNADLGGGEYARGNTFVAGDALPYPDTQSPPRYGDLQAALNFAAGALSSAGSIAIEIAGSASIAVAGDLAVDVPDATTLELRAADGATPTLLLDGEFVVTGGAGSRVVFNGLRIAGGTGMKPGLPSPAALVHLPVTRSGGSANALQTFALTDCTLVPGWSVETNGTPAFDAPALIVEPVQTNLVAARSILGAIFIAPLATASLTDCILDATDRTSTAYAALDGEAGGALTAIGCTIVGKVHATLLSLVSDSIVWASTVTGDGWTSGLVADRKQQGCVRFSFLPVNAVVPRHYECVEQALASVRPLFFSLRYGAPAYAKLLVSTDDAIRRGADDGGEMGVYHWLLAPQRESDLQIRLFEYLPVGLNFGLIYQT